MHWTQTPEGKAKLKKIHSKRKRVNWKNAATERMRYRTPKADLLEVLNSAWQNLATAQKIRALAAIIKEES